MIRCALFVEGSCEKQFFEKNIDRILDITKLKVKDVQFVIINLGGSVEINELISKIRKYSKSFDIVSSFVDYYGIRGLDQTSINKKDKFNEFFNSFQNYEYDNIIIPYIQIHEFETLFFSDLDKTKEIFKKNHIKEDKPLSKEIAGFNDIEMINCSQSTSPSHRIIKCYPEYKFFKTTISSQVLENIDMNLIKSKCCFFNLWVEKFIDTILNFERLIEENRKIISIL